MIFDLTKSLQEQENDDWGMPTRTTNMAKECHRLRRKPLQDFTPANLDVMIGQEISLEYLVPMALDVLTENPFLRSRNYHSDLLRTVLRIEPEFWKNEPELWWMFAEIVIDLEFLQEMLVTEFPSAIQNFQSVNKPSQQ